MLPRRAIAISQNRGLRKFLTTGLMSAGAWVDAYENLGDLRERDSDAAIIAFHITHPDDIAALRSLDGRLAPECAVIAVLNKSDLEATVEVLKVSPRIRCVLAATGLTASEIASSASRILYGDIFGMDKYVPWGTRVYSTLVASHQDKSACIAQLAQFAEAMGVRRKYREAIEQCADEMLMNALYDAPVDASGKPLFADVPIKERVNIRLEQHAVVQYACSGNEFVLSVRDSFGTLEPDTVVRYLDKCLHSSEQIDRKIHGAGLGIYIVASSASTMTFNLLPGHATESVVSFDLTASKIQLRSLATYEERIDASGRLTDRPPHVLPGSAGHPVERRAQPPVSRGVSTRLLTVGLSSAILLLLALIALVAYPRLVTQTGSISVATDPTGATIEIDGRTRGTTDEGLLTIDGLDVDNAYRVTARKDGYSSAETVVQPVTSRTTAMSFTLRPIGAMAILTSDPSGVAVSHGGRDLGRTPVTVSSLPPGETVELHFEKPGFVPVDRSVAVPAAGEEMHVDVAMPLRPDLASVAITSEPEGAQVLQNGELLASLLTPLNEHLVAAGVDHVFTLRLARHKPAQVRVRLESGQRKVPVHTVLEPGGGLTVRANVRARATVSGVAECTRVPLPMLDCPLADGEYDVRIDGYDPAIKYDFKVEITGDNVARSFEFGIVEADSSHKLELSGGRLARRAAFEPGSRTVTVVNQDNGQKKRIVVTVSAELRARVP